MKIYHGSSMIVEHPEIRMTTRTPDFGAGFYATTSHDQAVAWVRRKHKAGFVNVYEFDETQLKNFKTLSFHSPSDEWIDFVLSNRLGRLVDHGYDIVYGPVANDRVYAAFALFEQGVLDRETLLKELRVYDLVDQYLFHTPDALSLIRFVSAEEVSS